MRKLVYTSTALFFLATVPAKAQDVPQPPAKIAAGFSFSGGYNFTFWGNTEFSNIPVDLRTVTYAPGSIPITFDAGTFKQQRNMAPLKAGLVLNFQNRVELEGGLAPAVINQSNSKQIVSGCYCDITTGHLSGSRVMYGFGLKLSYQFALRNWFGNKATANTAMMKRCPAKKLEPLPYHLLVSRESVSVPAMTAQPSGSTLWPASQVRKQKSIRSFLQSTMEGKTIVLSWKSR
ncbi:MAG: hypothetical protein KW788_04170 [Candidatus Doudnabacteria bacterium]|nr:hypothetical protein [Candidatus Doudnabacteria bacterium]